MVVASRYPETYLMWVAGCFSLHSDTQFACTLVGVHRVATVDAFSHCAI